ncbi:MAG: TIGR00341 family protein [Dehalococcoidales bacterium]|nr:TIGR00341 family protein [Dehalococcoidales bacterium]
MTTAVPIIQNQHREAVSKQIRNDAALTKEFLVMNALAAIMASYGLFANSPAVVISAMIVATLLWPIAGVALALVDIDMKLLLKSLATLAAGTVAVIFTSFIIGTIHKDIPITQEILARTAPNFLDLMIALAGGAALAYATISPRLSVALVGVAIATALVPPLCAAGILFARGDVPLALGALLLFITNMVAIKFAASAVLWLIGFRRITRTKGMSLLIFARGHLIGIVILVVLAVVLSATLRQVVTKRLYESSTRAILQKEIESSLGSQLAVVQFEKTTSGKNIIRAVVRGPEPPSAAQVAALEDKLPVRSDGKKEELRIRFVHTTIINRHGPIFDNAKYGTPD